MSYVDDVAVLLSPLKQLDIKFQIPQAENILSDSIARVV